MESNQYRYMFEAEDRHWWYVGNHERFLDILKRKGLVRAGLKILDAGCGTGRWLQMLKTNTQIEETGIDYSPLAIELARTRGPLNLLQGDLNHYTLPEDHYDLITSFDVICNANIDDMHVLQRFHRSLKQDGTLLISLPAFKFLMGKHDRLVHQNKRYKTGQVKRMMIQNGFHIIKLSYTVSLLFPFALLKRWFGNLRSAKESEHNEVAVPSAFINRSFLAIMRLENMLFRSIPLPPGLSVVVLAKKTIHRP